MIVDKDQTALLIEVKDLIARRFAEDIKLNELARQAGYSPYHFQRVFTREFGESPNDFRRRLRLSQARSLLQNTTMEIGEVCLAVGYSSPETFAKLFKTRYGITPVTFRDLANSQQHGGVAIIPSCFLHNRKIE